MAAAIPKAAVTTALEVLERHRESFWGNVAVEVQNRGAFVLFSVQVPDDVGDLAARYEQTLKRDLEVLFPTRSDDYAWMLVFKSQDTVVASYFGHGKA